VEKIFFPNLLIVAGSNSKSGKTTAICRIVNKLNAEVTAIKITPHYHELTPGLVEVMHGDGYSVRNETDPGTGKDTSRMLQTGAKKVYLILAWEAPVKDAFLRVMKHIPGNIPVICESPSLRDYIEPGLFILMSSSSENTRDDLIHLVNYPHLRYRLENLADEDLSVIGFEDGNWRVTGFKNKD
jgi:hypothetical protein